MNSQHVDASKCEYQETLYFAPQFFRLSDKVFVGTVSSIYNSTNHEWKVKFDIEKTWKGISTQQVTATSNSLEGCGYSITKGEKYLVYANGSPVYLLTSYTKPYAEAQNEISLFDDPKFQYKEKLKGELIKKLEAAADALSVMVGSKKSEIPINSAGVDEINSVLVVGIDSTKASLSEDEYRKRIKEIVGDLPIKIEFGVISTLVPTCDNFFGKGGDEPIDLKYDIEGGSVVQICKSAQSPSVGVEVNSIKDGKLTITIPRKMVYSLDTLECDEGELFIIMDGEEILPVNTTRNKKDNVITVGFSKGIHKIEFVGSEIIPYPSPSMICGIARGYDSQFLPPRFQLENGVPLQSIRCNEGLELVLNSKNGKPACVRPQIIDNLFTKGWIRHLSCINENLVGGLGNQTFSCFCGQGEEFVKGGYHVRKESSLQITRKDNISNENNQTGIVIDIFNPQLYSQFVSVWSTCE